MKLFNITALVAAFLASTGMATENYKCTLSSNAPEYIPKHVFLKVDIEDRSVIYTDNLDLKSRDLPINIDANVNEYGVRLSWKLRRYFVPNGDYTLRYTGYFDLKKNRFRMTSSHNSVRLKDLMRQPAGFGNCKQFTGKFPKD